MRLLSIFLLLAACAPHARDYDFPRPVDTSTRPIATQTKRSYAFDDGALTFDNEFDGARLNGVTRRGIDTFVVSILPENEPINSSPWYALRIRTRQPRDLVVRLAYPPDVYHRYHPKLSTDGEVWTPVDSTRLQLGPDTSSLAIDLSLPAGTHYLAAQEVITATDVSQWLGTTFRQPYARLDIAGHSALGRPIPVLRLARESRYAGRPMVVFFSRQHPPEVTGYLALQAMLEAMIAHPRIEEFLDRYQVMVFPLINPDGVDLGHWRHTAGGIDANRDWAYYRQPETRRVADYVVRKSRRNDAPVLLGMDFHSTYQDVYYTFNATLPPSVLPGFKDDWLRAIERKLGGGFAVNEEAEPLGRPTSAGWFRTQFNAEALTYEIGDATDRAFVRRKGQASAEALIELLLAR